MAPASITTTTTVARRIVGSRRRTKATSPPDSPPPKKLKPISEILAKAQYAVVERADYGDVSCMQCGSGERAEELLLCDKCDKGFHMKCVRPIVVRVPIGSWLCPKCSGQRRVRRLSQRKIIDFFRIQKCNHKTDKCSSPQDIRKHRRRSGSLVYQKRRRRLLPFVSSEDPAQRLKQMGTLASALTELQMEFSDDLTYSSGMAPRSANQARFEEGGMQVLTKEDIETLEQCRAMCKRGDCPPLLVVFDSREGFTVEADGQIKDMTFIAEYTGDVDYIRNREHDDCDSMMTLLLAKDPSKSLVICPDKRGNIARFISGINNHTLDGKKKQNCKCVRYSVNGECRVFLVATRDIAKGERLYYDYNGYEHEYPTQHFV
ncbi:probable Histone-lysine N-methyltransferase ATXR5 [Ricinus communis]|uniref:Probable Histone-lysine N-methyltransferase ATXR5 n=2 Tax=Ricinus communis TaxID=3988 RepID=ATXR5_RICCO|nr:probable Histone-lysine N-methyltransferase ATXR5 [Ricinus communis]B9RU15.1 RecName: Full=Probable Histone-lysine N-methyltransferase ATXR5; Flags: Precursor [Ricinus communis]EEF45134.1 Histone-lysine N-methyltransferase ATXR6, putative [Ricinus communis]|eukprot:XP_002517234.1 probable Histone-lysine N-methyltransferase ATXR5 [Ricinus communis]